MVQQIKANFRITSQAFVAADVDITADTIRLLNHGLRTGDLVGLVADTTAGAALPAGTTVGTAYYVIQSDGSHIQLATSYANAFAGTAVNITSVGTTGATVYKNGGRGWSLLQSVPVNAIIRNFSYDVITTFSSSLDLGAAVGDNCSIRIALVDVSAARVIAGVTDQNLTTVALGAANAAEISNGANSWDASTTIAGEGVSAITAANLLPDFATVDNELKPITDLMLAVQIGTDGVNSEGIITGEMNILLDYVWSATAV